MSNLHLYELTDRYRELALLAESDELPADVIRDTLEGLGGDWEAKAEAVAMYIKNIEAASEAKKEASKAMAERARMLEARAKSMRQYLLLQFQLLGKTRVERPAFALVLKNNPPAVIVDDETKVPEFFKVQPPMPPPTIDKKAISAAFKAGNEVEGCHVEQGQRVDIVI